MGHNGPHPGDHITVKGGAVAITRTFLVSGMGDPKLPKPGDCHPLYAQYVAGKPRRREHVRPHLWSVDVPYGTVGNPPATAADVASAYDAGNWTCNSISSNAIVGDAGRLTVSYDFTYHPPAPTGWDARTALRRYELAPAVPLWPWACLILAGLIAWALYTGVAIP